MRSLNDVIKAAECCAGVSHCSKCPYFDRRKKIMGCMDVGHGRNHFIEDALLYLKHYKEGTDVSQFLEE